MSEKNKFEQLIPVALLILLAAGSLVVLYPFVSAILWATLLSFATWPLFQSLTAALKGRRTLSALLLCGVFALIIIGPFVILGATLAESADEIASRAHGLLAAGIPAPPDWIARIPLIGENVHAFWDSARADSHVVTDPIRKALPTVTGWLAAQGASLGAGLLQMSLAVFVVFFLYRDGEALAARLDTAMHRIGGEHARALLGLAGNTVKGVVYGILGTALAQGALAGLGFWIAGVPMAFLLGVATFFLSIVPMGPPLIWIPAAAWLYYQGETGWAIFLVLWGALLVSSIDNVLKPYLISQGAAMPFLLVLLGVLGGMIAFGFIGVFLGPTILAIAYSLVGDWTRTPRADSAPAPHG